MPISDAADEAAYRAAIRDFVDCHVPARGTLGVVQAYRAVQAFPYRSVADRRPLTALRNMEGACTAKHLVLRDVLRAIGETAVVEIVEGDFASGLPVHDSMDPALQAMIREGGVTDMHCRVRLGDPKRVPCSTSTPPFRRRSCASALPSIATGGAMATRRRRSRVSPYARGRRMCWPRRSGCCRIWMKTPPRERKEFLRLLTEWLAGVDMH